MDVADYMSRVYGSPPCWDLVADVYTNELGATTVEGYTTVTESVRAIARAFRLQLHKNTHGFVQVADPVDFAVVLMGRTPKVGIHHAGIYYDGKVLHALDTGTLYQDLPSLRDEYTLMEFWAK